MRSDHHNEETTCLIEMRFAADGMDDALKLLLSGIERTEVKPGCRSCSLTRNVREPERVCYREVWITEDAFRTHVRSEEFRRVLVAMDCSCEAPEVTISTPAGRSGMAYLRDLHVDRRSDLDPV